MYNSAIFLKDGEIVNIPAQDLMSKAIPYYVMDGYNFVAYPNRNSVPFREFYNIPEAHTVIRGSLRYEGNPAFIRALIELGWIDSAPKDWLIEGMTWAQIWQKLVKSESTEERYTLYSKIVIKMTLTKPIVLSLPALRRSASFLTRQRLIASFPASDGWVFSVPARPPYLAEPFWTRSVPVSRSS